MTRRDKLVGRILRGGSDADVAYCVSVSSVRTSRGCVRPCGLDGALAGLSVQPFSAGVCRKISSVRQTPLLRWAHHRDILLTPRFKTLQSP